MGWTNSVLIFYDDVSYILQPKIPTWTVPYIDDIPVKGPLTCYETSDSKFNTLPSNPGIQCFVWEHFETLNQIIQCMKYCSSTFSGVKLFLCIPKITVLGHICTYEGQIMDESRVATQEDLKQALISSPALKPINYTSSSPIILAVNTVTMNVGSL